MKSMIHRRVMPLFAGIVIVAAACSSTGGGASGGAGGASAGASSGASSSAGAAASAGGSGGAGCTVGVSWNNYQQPRWAKADEPAMKKAIEDAGGQYIRADANLKMEQQLTD